jgi:hypothetical protein
VRVLDVNNDGFMDVVIGNENVRQTRIWSPEHGTWVTTDFPASIVIVDGDGDRHDSGVRFGVLQSNGYASLLVRNETAAGLWHFDGQRWIEAPAGLEGLELDGPVLTSLAGRDTGVRLRDLDGDSICELIVGGPQRQAVFRWTGSDGWARLPFRIAARDFDRGRSGPRRRTAFRRHRPGRPCRRGVLRRRPLLVASIHVDARRMGTAGSLAAPRTEGDCIPMIVRADGTNNGAWFRFRHMWVQNEETGARLTPSQTDSRAYEALSVGQEVPSEGEVTPCAGCSQ